MMFKFLFTNGPIVNDQISIFTRRAKEAGLTVVKVASEAIHNENLFAFDTSICLWKFTGKYPSFC